MKYSTSASEAVNPMAQLAREAAAKSTDPHEVESLMRSAEQIERTHRMLLETHALMVQDLENSKAHLEDIRTRDHLPNWVIILVIVSFIVFLILASLKHQA